MLCPNMDFNVHARAEFWKVQLVPTVWLMCGTQDFIAAQMQSKCNV